MTRSRTPTPHPPNSRPPIRRPLVGLAAGVPLRALLIVQGHITPGPDTPTQPVARAGLSAGPLTE